MIDGAKRDRAVWPGDLAIAQATAFVSTDDTVSARNSLNILYQHQAATGGLPFCGPPINLGVVSDTYHLWTLIASADYFSATRDKSWLDDHWDQYKRATQFSLDKVDENGVLSITLPLDWGRTTQLGETISANALLYRVLRTGSFLGEIEGDSATARRFATAAAGLKESINDVFWDSAVGQYRDTPDGKLYPQDGNALAVLFGIADAPGRALTVSQQLRANWNSYGAQSPEKQMAIGTFPGSLEVLSHFAANDDETGLDLIRLEWGYMLKSGESTKSTFWEGYRNDGSFDHFGSDLTGSYMSHAHGWATGPTVALTYFVLGLMPDISGKYDYSLTPHPGNLTRVAGIQNTPNGPVEILWQNNPATGTFSVAIKASNSITGKVGLPTFGHLNNVRIDGKLEWSGCSEKTNNSPDFESVTTDTNYVYFLGIKGTHVIDVSPSCGL